VSFLCAFYPVGERVVPDPSSGGFNCYEELYLNSPEDKGLRAVRLEHAPRYDFVVINARKAMLCYHSERGDKAATVALWYLTQTQKRPVYAVRKQGALLVGVYARE
jgi:hypothetical protein